MFSYQKIMMGISKTYKYSKFAHYPKFEIGNSTSLQIKRSSYLTKSARFNFSTQINDMLIKPARFDFDAFGGLPEVIDNLADIVKFLQNPNAYKRMGAKLPKGIMLSEPPGVGKTMLAEAVAGHAGVGFISISGSQILDKYVGESEKSLQRIFEQARKSAPCVLCIDEIDSIATKRIENPEHGNEHGINAL